MLCYRDWLPEWLDKERVGRHDDGYDAGSAAAASGSEDELATCPQTSSVDTGNKPRPLSYHQHRYRVMISVELPSAGSG